MHYLVVAVGTGGDLNPFLHLGRALQGLGHRLTFLTNAVHAAAVESAGLPLVTMGTVEEHQQLLANPDVWDPRKGFAALMGNYSHQINQMVEAIAGVSAEGEKVVLAHPFAVPAAVMARQKGWVRSVVGVWLAPSNLRTCHDPLFMGPLPIPRWVPMGWRRALWRMVDRRWVDPVVVPQINASRQALGLPGVDSFLNHMVQGPDLSLTLFPDWFGPTQPDWPRPLISGDFQMAAPNAAAALSPELSAFLEAGDRPVIFTPGTGHRHAASFFAAAVSATTRLGLRAIFLTRERAQVPAELPPSVLWQSFVPMGALLPRARALVHHGGIGTTADALRAGLPQLVVPFAWDQFDNGARVAALGAGLVLPARRVRPGNLARRLQRLCGTPAIAEQCAQVATRFQPPHDTGALCAEVVQWLEAPPAASTQPR
ncbi:MAG: glycosyltransferase family 1 protein [Ramlibacter sp.]|nr:glycosyltransferase family 1 protein [Ramlibacter sp.]